MEPLRALLLAVYVLACALPVGMVPVRWWGRALLAGEHAVVAWSCGLGLIATSLTLVGLAGAFVTPVVLVVPGLLAVSALAVLARFGGETSLPFPRLTPAPVAWAGALPFTLLLLCVVVSGLAPPTDYDGLLYHLVAPRAYLDAGRLVYLSHNFSANLPMFGEMLFAVGLAGGSDRAPQLVHAGAGALSVGLTLTLGSRLLPARGARVAALAVAGTPLIPFLATRAYIDLFTVVFVTASLLLIAVWLRARDDGLLALAGLVAGFAISSKYAALTAIVPAGIVLITAAVVTGGGRAAVRAGVAYGAAAFLTSLPWTLRQSLELGNPVWPMYLGGRDWDAARVEQLTYFVNQYGSGRSLRDWLLLPFNVYWESWRFGHVPWSFPPPLALMVPFAVLAPQREVRGLLLAAALTVALWARGWQDLRYLLSIYPLLAVLGVTGLLALHHRWGERIAIAIVTLGFLVTLGREGARTLDRLPVLLGWESNAAFLTRSISSFAAVSALNQRGAPGSSALFLGEAQIWYCRPRCIPDPAHDNLLMFFLGGAPESRVQVPAAMQRLRAEGVDHVLLSKKDFWYLEHQDPENRLKRQLAEFYVFKAQHLELVYEDELTELYQVRW